jgi:hypothetical protein
MFKVVTLIYKRYLRNKSNKKTSTYRDCVVALFIILLALVVFLCGTVYVCVCVLLVWGKSGDGINTQIDWVSFFTGPRYVFYSCLIIILWN